MEIINWKSALERSSYDKKVGIKIAKLCGDAQFSTFITSIDPGKSVNPHYHKHGNEHYHIIDGTGEIELVDVATRNLTKTAVSQGCSFVVESNKIHSLKNTDKAPLILMFSCPESHLAEDRYLD